MPSVLRVTLAVLAGFAAAFVLVVAVELYSSVVHPAPPDFKGTPEEICQLVERYPQWVLATVVPMWAFAAFLGTWIAGRIGNLGSAIFLALLLLAAVLCNISMLPYPLWFKVVQPIAIVAAAIGGIRISTRR